LGDLITKQYLDKVDSPDSDAYILTAAAADTDYTSYIKIIDGKVVGVRIVTATRGISVVGTTEIPTKSISRSNVVAKESSTP
jgi:hypothetical protein